MTYHTVCFGGPPVTASQMSNPQFLEQERALGMFGGISLSALGSITFGLSRGLFTQCPILLACAPGFYLWLKRSLAPEEQASPLYGYTYPMFFEGKLSPYPFKIKLLSTEPRGPELSEHAMWNVRELLGLSGLPSLVPLLLIVAALSARYATQRSKSPLASG